MQVSPCKKMLCRSIDIGMTLETLELLDLDKLTIDVKVVSKNFKLDFKSMMITCVETKETTPFTFTNSTANFEPFDVG